MVPPLGLPTTTLWSDSPLRNWRATVACLPIATTRLPSKEKLSPVRNEVVVPLDIVGNTTPAVRPSAILAFALRAIPEQARSAYGRPTAAHDPTHQYRAGRVALASASALTRPHEPRSTPLLASTHTGRLPLLSGCGPGPRQGRPSRRRSARGQRLRADVAPPNGNRRRATLARGASIGYGGHLRAGPGGLTLGASPVCWPPSLPLC
jgi:hypothetical protein